MKPEELKEALASGVSLKLIDVREKEEVELGEDGIPGTEHIPMGKMFVFAAKGELPKDQKIVTICSKGGRCEIVSRELKQKGFDIDYLEGGLEAWNEVSGTNS